MSHKFDIGINVGRKGCRYCTNTTLACKSHTSYSEVCNTYLRSYEFVETRSNEWALRQNFDIKVLCPISQFCKQVRVNKFTKFYVQCTWKKSFFYFFLFFFYFVSKLRKYPQVFCDKCMRSHIGDEIYSKIIFFSRHPTLKEEESIIEQLNRKIFEDSRKQFEDSNVGN